MATLEELKANPQLVMRDGRIDTTHPDVLRMAELLTALATADGAVAALLMQIVADAFASKVSANVTAGRVTDDYQAISDLALAIALMIMKARG